MFDDSETMRALVDSRHAAERRHTADRRLAAAGRTPRRRFRIRMPWTNSFGVHRVDRRNQSTRPAEPAAA